MVMPLCTQSANGKSVSIVCRSSLICVLQSVRTASVEVIEALISAGADPNCKNQHNTAITPLTLVLLRGASSTAVGSGLIGQGEEAAFGLSGALLTHSVDTSSAGGDFAESHGANGKSFRHSTSSAAAAPEETDKSSSLVGRRVWIKAAEMLVKSGEYLLH